jgi:hypothetical protein
MFDVGFRLNVTKADVDVPPEKMRYGKSDNRLL